MCVPLKGLAVASFWLTGNYACWCIYWITKFSIGLQMFPFGYFTHLSFKLTSKNPGFVFKHLPSLSCYFVASGFLACLSLYQVHFAYSQENGLWWVLLIVVSTAIAHNRNILLGFMWVLGLGSNALQGSCTLILLFGASTSKAPESECPVSVLFVC